MSKIIAMHSYKGGTGKTLLSINLAAAFAKHGKKVCLLDLDFRAPSLSENNARVPTCLFTAGNSAQGCS